MPKPKLTPWFPSGIKPRRPGVYEVTSTRVYLIRLFQHWDGSQWGGWASSVQAAHKNRGLRSARQLPEWRGLAKEPRRA